MVTTHYTGIKMTDSSNSANVIERNQILEAYFKDNYRNLVNKVKGRAGSMENAEDVVQDSFERALRYWDSFDNSGKELGAWFNTILNNSLRNKMKDEKNFGMSMEFDEELADGIEMSQTNAHMLEVIKKEISCKNAFNQEVLKLYFLKDYRPKAIVEVLDAKLKTVKQCILRFKTDLKDKYGVDMK